MKVKLTSSLGGDRYFSFRPRQVIECSKEAGVRLISHGVAVEAPGDAAAEGKLVDLPPLRKRRGRKPGEHRLERVRHPEKATVAAPEAAVTAGAPVHCAGTTKKNNPCMKAPEANSQFCAIHIEVPPGTNAEDQQAEAEG